MSVDLWPVEVACMCGRTYRGVLKGTELPLCADCGEETVPQSWRVEFKPSQVRLDTFPFVGTFHRAENEFAAALLVRACVGSGDEWRAQAPRAIGAQYGADVGAKVFPIEHLARNPFIGADFRGLVTAGFAEWADESERAPVRFTAAGFDGLRKFVEPPR